MYTAMSPAHCCPLSHRSCSLSLRSTRPRYVVPRERQHPRCATEKFLQVQQPKSSEGSTSNGSSSSSSSSPVSGPSSSPSPSTTPPRTALFRATKQQSLTLEEQQKPLASYMALPASQYSVLDAKKIVRLDDNTFKCFVGGLNFGAWTVEPVLTVSVMVEDQGCTIKLLSCELEGPSIVQQINQKFRASMSNVVRYEDTASPTAKAISSDTTIEVCLEIPGWCSFIPASAISSTGSSVMQTTLNVMVPRFLQQLEKDYKMWASGDESRKPVGEL